MMPQIHLLSNFSPLQHHGFLHETGFPCYKFSCPTLLMIEYYAGYLFAFYIMFNHLFLNQLSTHI